MSESIVPVWRAARASGLSSGTQRPGILLPNSLGTKTQRLPLIILILELLEWVVVGVVVTVSLPVAQPLNTTAPATKEKRIFFICATVAGKCCAEASIFSARAYFSLSNSMGALRLTKDFRMRSVRRLFQIMTLLALGCAGPASPILAASSPARFAGIPVAPGATVSAQVPLNAQEQTYASEGGNNVPPYAVATLAVPPGFNPTKTWPVLIALSTSDFKIQNRDDLAHLYRETAFQEGWLVIAGDGPTLPHRDSSGWRASMTLAALDALHHSFPGSERWPVACAGYSGGAKRTGLLAPLFSVAGCRIIGIYLTGINVDTLSDGYRQFRPGKEFLHTPVFISSGQEDKVATLQQQWDVKRSIQLTGFDRVRLETFSAGHVVKRSHIHEALSWFRAPAATTLTR